MNIFNDSDVKVEGWILENGGVICASLGVRGGRWYLMPKGGVGGRWITPKSCFFPRKSAIT